MRLDLVAEIQDVAANPYCCCSPLKTLGEVEEVVTSMFDKIEEYWTSTRRFAAICNKIHHLCSNLWQVCYNLPDRHTVLLYTILKYAWLCQIFIQFNSKSPFLPGCCIFTSCYKPLMLLQTSEISWRGRRSWYEPIVWVRRVLNKFFRICSNLQQIWSLFAAICSNWGTPQLRSPSNFVRHTKLPLYTNFHVITSMFDKLEQYQTSLRRFAAICNKIHLCSILWQVYYNPPETPTVLMHETWNMYDYVKFFFNFIVKVHFYQVAAFLPVATNP